MAGHARVASAVSSLIDVVRADITRLDVDAIVNAANEQMLGGGGVDGAIHRAAGRQLYEACLAVPEVRPGVRCPTGESRITPGFNLRARYVIHTVGPVWRGGTHGEPALLASCYHTALELARQHRLRTIAFPAISCGVYGYPLDQAAAIAVRETRAAEEEYDCILLVAFGDEMFGILSRSIRSDRSSRSKPQNEPNEHRSNVSNGLNGPNGPNGSND
jgi:O-acetyl-ADP-ribose deacetylase (regulator of RNase III)